MVLGGSWWFMAVLDGAQWLFVVIYGSWWFFVVPRCYFFLLFFFSSCFCWKFLVGNGSSN